MLLYLLESFEKLKSAHNPLKRWQKGSSDFSLSEFSVLRKDI